MKRLALHSLTFVFAACGGGDAPATEEAPAPAEPAEAPALGPAAPPATAPAPPAAAAVAAAGERAPVARGGEAADPPSPEPSALHAAPEPSEVWALVRRLEQYAAEGVRFHARALPVVLRLRELVSDADGRAEDRDALSAEVVGDATRAARVRGAVFLALAPALDGERFGARFREWVLHPDVPAELTRAAALAAEARGTPSACASAVDLRRYAELPMAPGVAPPELYPLRLTRVVGDAEAAALHELVAAWSPDFEPARSSAADADLLVTRELALLVLGQRALVDPRTLELVERVVEQRDLDTDFALIAIRASFYVVHSLAACRDAWRERVDRWAAGDGDALALGLAELLRSRFVGTPHEALLEQLELHRRSSSLSDQLRQLEALDELTALLAPDADPVAPELRRRSVDLLMELAIDPEEEEMVRRTAILSLLSSADGASVCDVAEILLGSPLDAAHHGDALAALQSVDAAIWGDQLRAVLARAQATVVDPTVRESLDRLRAELEGAQDG